MESSQLSWETQDRIKDMFVFVGDQEIQIEKIRSQLCAIKEFEPYTTF